MASVHPASPEGITISHQHPSYRIDKASLHALLSHALKEEGRSLHSLSVVLADHETVRELNRSYLGHDYDTDVLAFPLDDDTTTIVGEIYVDLDTAYERHEEFNATFQEEAYRYALHGLLHLMGYRDKTPEQRAQIRSREDRYLSILQ